MSVTVRALELADRQPLMAALAAAVPDSAPSPPAATLPAFGEWLAANPAGLRTFVAFADGEVVGHLSAVPRLTRIGADSRRFAELVGGWVAPRRRRGLRRMHDFQRLANALFEAHQGVERDFVYHGCPAPRERRLGYGLLDWKPVTTLPLLHFDLRAFPHDRPSTGVEEIGVFDERFAGLFERCIDDCEAATVRDATFLKHRFLDHPGGPFVVLGEFEPGGSLAGYVVLRRSADPRSPATIVLWDWLVPAREEAVGARLLAAALLRAKAMGGIALAGFVPEWSPWFTRFQDLGFRVRPSNRFLFARTSARRYDSHWLHQGWWHTLADTVVEPQWNVPGGGR